MYIHNQADTNLFLINHCFSTDMKKSSTHICHTLFLVIQVGDSCFCIILNILHKLNFINLTWTARYGNTLLVSLCSQYGGLHPQSLPNLMATVSEKKNGYKASKGQDINERIVKCFNVSFDVFLMKISRQNKFKVTYQSALHLHDTEITGSIWK